MTTNINPCCIPPFSTGPCVACNPVEDMKSTTYLYAHHPYYGDIKIAWNEWYYQPPLECRAEWSGYKPGTSNQVNFFCPANDSPSMWGDRDWHIHYGGNYWDIDVIVGVDPIYFIFKEHPSLSPPYNAAWIVNEDPT